MGEHDDDIAIVHPTRPLSNLADKQVVVLFHDPLDAFMIDARPILLGKCAIVNSGDAPVAVGWALCHQFPNALRRRRIPRSIGLRIPLRI